MMKLYYQAKRQLKIVRWCGRRGGKALRWGPKTLKHSPKVFGNAMPKSGSHLLTQILFSLPRLGPFVNPGFPPINRSEANEPLPKDQVVANIRMMRSGDIRYGYLPCKEPYLAHLTSSRWASIFLYRDPRDLLVSHVFYATEMNPDHGMHRYYTEILATMEARINAAIEGVTEPGFKLPSVRERYDQYLGWLRQTEVLPIRFEELVGNLDTAINRLLDYLESKGISMRISRSNAMRVINSSIDPRKSGTFRRGRSGSWQKYFTEVNKERFKAVAGDLLVQLKYESSNDW